MEAAKESTKEGRRKSHPRFLNRLNVMHGVLMFAMDQCQRQRQQRKQVHMRVSIKCR